MAKKKERPECDKCEHWEKAVDPANIGGKATGFCYLDPPVPILTPSGFIVASYPPRNEGDRGCSWFEIKLGTISLNGEEG